MIDVKELRIGNYVYFEPYDKKEPLIIDEIVRFGENRYQVTIKESNMSCFLDECLPITLTEELLLEYGFKKDDETIAVTLFCDEEISMYVDQSGTIREWQYDVELKYFHQLQNLYYNLTRKELEKQ